MKVFAGCFVDHGDPENLPEVFIAATETELAEKLAQEARMDYTPGMTMSQLEEILSEEDDGDDMDINYNGFVWSEKDL